MTLNENRISPKRCIYIIFTWKIVFQGHIFWSIVFSFSTSYTLFLLPMVKIKRFLFSNLIIEKILLEKKKNMQEQQKKSKCVHRKLINHVLLSQRCPFHTTECFIYYCKYILVITQPSLYRCTQLQCRFAETSQAPSTDIIDKCIDF